MLTSCYPVDYAKCLRTVPVIPVEAVFRGKPKEAIAVLVDIKGHKICQPRNVFGNKFFLLPGIVISKHYTRHKNQDG